MVELFSLYMTALKQHRTIRVYVPKHYDKGEKHYPVLYMHDGQNVFSDDEAIGGISLGLEQYLNEQEYELIVVAVDQNPEERMNEYCPWEIGEYSKKHFGQVDLPGGKGKDYVDFIINDLKPFMDKKYRTLNNQNSIAGISLGGLISVYAACSYPQVFHKVAAISSAFLRNQEEIETYIQHSNLFGVKGIYMDCGDSETNDEGKNKEFVASNKRVYELLNNKAQNVKFDIIPEGRHHYEDFKKRVPAFLEFIK